MAARAPRKRFPYGPFLSIAFLVIIAVVTALLIVLAAGPSSDPSQTGQNGASSASLQVPSVPTETEVAQGKPGESGPPTPFPTYSLPPMTPVPPDGDQGFYTTPTPGFYIPPTPQPTDPYVLYINVTSGLGSIKEQTAQSDHVVMGIIKQVGPARWTTPDGTRPANPWASDNRHYIFTPVVVQVTNAFKGLKVAEGAAGTEISFLTVGGEVGQDRVVVPGDNDLTFEVGQQVVLFLDNTAPNDLVQVHNNRPLMKYYGRYTVTPEGRAKNSSRDVSLPELINEIEKAAQGRSGSSARTSTT